MKILFPLMLIVALFTSGCMHEPIHQGNRLDYNKVLQISEGVTKFRVEQLLGSPAVASSLNPHRALYYEEFEDEESGDMIKRGIEITYDDALRVKSIREFGFPEQ